MKKFDKWFLPDCEEHLPEIMSRDKNIVDGRLTYQYHKYLLAKKHVKNFDVAVDIGAHVGLWSYWMARDFKHLAAFEPVREHQGCWYENMKERTNAELFEVALGSEIKRVSFVTGANSTGDTSVDVKAGGNIDMMPLDTFNFPKVDFIKIDCEGYELAVLKGAQETLLRCKPCIIVEQKKAMGEKYNAGAFGALEFLNALGAKKREEYSGDYVYSWA